LLRTGGTYDYNTCKLKPAAECLDWASYILDGLLQPPIGYGRLYLSDLRQYECVMDIQTKGEYGRLEPGIKIEPGEDGVLLLTRRAMRGLRPRHVPVVYGPEPRSTCGPWSNAKSVQKPQAGAAADTLRCPLVPRCRAGRGCGASLRRLLIVAPLSSPKRRFW
jgi:hypothetical protein